MTKSTSQDIIQCKGVISLEFGTYQQRKNGYYTLSGIRQRLYFLLVFGPCLIQVHDGKSVAETKFIPVHPMNVQEKAMDVPRIE
jgi:hypothetical protein